MGTTVKDLFSCLDCTIIGNPSEPVTGLQYRSDACQEGDVFFCIVGLNVDGHSFAQDAIDHGARVLVCERKVYLADATDVTEVVVPDSRRAMAAASAAFYGNPSEAFDCVGITGTNGKTTTTYLVEHVMRSAGKSCGVIGTVGVQVNGKREKLSRTTPESPDLQEIFATMRDANVDVVAMEVSSHALDLSRTWGTKFAVTAFSNLTQDHLDYHNTFEAYFEAKALLFSDDYPAARVICIDDEWGMELSRRCHEAGDRCITCGLSPEADIHPTSVEYHATHSLVALESFGEQQPAFEFPLVGKFNVSNAMLAYGICLALGVADDAIASALSAAPQVPGRLQRIDGGPSSPSVFVDYAHTPDALEKAIDSVKAISRGRTIVVFGCGGDRDATKRPIMGRASLAADYVFVTSDNPRTEDPMAIIAAIESGMADKQERYTLEPDRAKAIRLAIDCANPEDCVLVAGKGHEDYQIIGDEVRHFSDAEVIAEVLAG